MSPTVGNFVHDLVEMAKAMEELPQVRAELDRCQKIADDKTDHIMNLEQHIVTLKQELEAAHHATRKAEAERESAETMFLEADERTHSALAFIKTQFGAAGALIQSLEPPAPEPAQPAPVVSPEVAVQSTEQVPAGGVSGQSEANPTHSNATVSGEQTALAPTAVFTTDAPTQQEPLIAPVANVGQSEPLPPAQSTEAPSAPTAPSTAEPVTASTQQTSGETIAKGPYHGKLYMREPGFISRMDWLAGGGTEDAYYWREGQPLPDGIAA